jgi:hypothetical protein
MWFPSTVACGLLFLHGSKVAQIPKLLASFHKSLAYPKPIIALVYRKAYLTDLAE